MDIKSFKLNELNTLSKVLLTKSEAIGLCKRGNHKVRKIFLKQLVGKLLEIEDVRKMVDNAITDPIIRKLHE